MFTSIVTTGDRFEEDMIENGVIVARKGDLKLWQKIIAVGNSVRDLHEGEMVMINAENYVIKRYDKNSLQNDIDNNPSLGYHFNWVTIDDENDEPKECLLLNDRDILYAFEGEERNSPLITNGKSKLIIN